MTRLHRILTDADTDLAEVWMALLVCAFGTSVLNPFASAYAAGTAFRALQQLGVTETMYGAATAGAGLLHLFVVLHRGLRARTVLMVVQTAGCAATTALLGYGNPRGYGCWLFGVALVMGLLLTARLAARTERMRQRQARWDPGRPECRRTSGWN